ncbi:hypothetical protein [Bradyrhizobium sp. Leo170]|uniref:hypothetical protein n=1 Tax=Bradyrhizobium sp. Leo170 TaxID=1571199 RepID=UPI00102E27D1|nr:hypothetical protein [Bradyrhizobium sp. Leo170]
MANDDPQETAETQQARAPKLAHRRDLAACRPLVLDDSSSDELLDDWMVAYPGTELVASAA